MDAPSLEKVLRRTNPTITEERRALASGRWEAYLRERVPPPSWLEPSRRRAWKAAFERARQLGATSETRSAVIFPVWLCANEDDVPRREWAQAVCVTWDDGAPELYEGASMESVVVVAQLEEARIGFLMPSRFYGPGVELPYRNEHYVAVESRRIERVAGVNRVVHAEPAPAPSREVAAFTTDAEPGIALEGLEPALALAVRRATERLRVAPDVYE